MKELTENDEPLRQLLREWIVDSTLPPRFQEQVWRRIVHREEEVKPNLRQAFIHWLDTTFNRPALAVSYVAVLLSAGLTTGYLQAQDKSAHAESQWRAMYVQSVDPYQAPRN
jgi:hypothetical protein